MRQELRRQVFEGVKVADFSQAMAGPVAVRLLADYGATVIHVESEKRIETMRVSRPYKDGIPGINRGLVFSNYECNKLGMTLNLKHPRGLEIAKRLVAWADILVENFAPGVMESNGLGYEDVIKIKPDIIMLRVSNQGQSGPYVNNRGYGPQVTAQAGFPLLLGWPDREPLLPWTGLYADLVSTRWAAVALISALDYRRRTGKGQLLDLSMVEASLTFLAPQVLDYCVNGRDLARIGNRHPSAAPHGVYQCKGEDAWCAIAVLSDGEWKAFCEAIGSPSWTNEPRFATPSGRKDNEDELDSLITEWTIRLPAEEIMNVLQGVGIAAGVVKQIPEICQDPQLEHRQHFWLVDHHEIGTQHVDSWSFRLSRTPSELRRAGPCLGQDNEYVYTGILGFTSREYINLLTEGVLE
ncbi:CaiB/BaiF CoA transferase family protein [Chloroflexota bacterium]